MSLSDLWTLSAAEIADGVRAARWSAREVLAVHLERVERVESTVHAFPTLTPEIAEAQADAVDEKVARGLDPGPLAGVPIGIKDMLLTAGVRTTFGSVMFENNVPDVDEPVVRQVRDAGAVMLGKTNVPEFAFSSVGHNPIFETTTNPWDPSKTSGGSSAGSAAAIAAGECPIALGTDRAGSIRIPAAHCGIVGFKPTKGIVPDNGTNDSPTTTGPMARTVDDAELLLSVLAGFSEADPHSVPVGPLSTLRRRWVDSTSCRRQPRLGLRTGRRRGAHARCRPPLISWPTCSAGEPRSSPRLGRIRGSTSWPWRWPGSI